MKKLLKIIGIVLLVVVVLVGGLFGVLTLTEYRPADTEAVTAEGTAAGTFRAGDPLTVVSWNIGYGALGDNADFFMDGGKGVRTADEGRVRANLASMTAEAASLSPDLLYLQEVDTSSDRSYRIDEGKAFADAMDGFVHVFATNYRALFVPYPIPPIGHVDGGIMTLSRALIASAERIQLPCPFSWPLRLGNLKRCLLVSRIPVEGTDKELVAVNLHLEAYDSGEGKAAQTEQLAALLEDEAGKGNYVIAGGDFNQLFSCVDASAWPVYEGKWQPGLIEAEAFPSGLTLLMDNRTASCRSLDQPLAGADLTHFQYYLIDGFIVSSNIEVESVETQDLGFTASDHNPVVLKIRLAE